MKIHIFFPPTKVNVIPYGLPNGSPTACLFTYGGARICQIYKGDLSSEQFVKNIEYIQNGIEEALSVFRKATIINTKYRGGDPPNYIIPIDDERFDTIIDHICNISDF